MDVQIIKLIRNDKKISTEKIADVLGVSTKTVKASYKENEQCKICWKRI
ncbi:MAG: AsnC family protein [Anaerostipes hadrus]